MKTQVICSTQTSEEQIRLFASRFSSADWQQYCLDERFLSAVNRLAFDEAEVIAWHHLNQEINSPAFHSAVERRCNRDLEHSQICEFVRVWAAKTNRTGGDHKQSRQNRIRRLMKHGLNSDYARKMLAEAGMVG